jgi:ABC-2 type transport system ATP-binding protein
MDTVVEMRGLQRRFGKLVAVDGLDLTIPRGGVYALLGPNGAGKTTTISILLGLLTADAGELRVFGQRPGTLAVRRRLGAMLQVSGVPGTLTVGELVAQFSGYYPAPRPLAETLQLAGLDGLQDRRFDRLSGGQRQRLLFALAICGRPQLLVLDEPTVGLDVAMRRQLWEVIRNLAADGCTVLLTTHHLEEADALADRIGVLLGGRLIAEGSPAAIKARVGGRMLRCRSGLPAATLAALPGVRGLRVAGGRFELQVDSAEAVLRELLMRDPELAELEVSSLALEDAFLSLTGGDATEPAGPSATLQSPIVRRRLPPAVAAGSGARA